MRSEAGVSAPTIQRWLGYADLSTTLRYLAVRRSLFGAYTESGDLLMVLIVVVVAMTVVAILPLLVMSIGVTMAVIMILPAPGAFTIMPPTRSMLVMRTGPICARIGWSYIVTGDPAIVLTLGRPETA
jgi:hypothetical protein